MVEAVLIEIFLLLDALMVFVLFAKYGQLFFAALAAAGITGGLATLSTIGCIFGLLLALPAAIGLLCLAICGAQYLINKINDADGLNNNNPNLDENELVTLNSSSSQDILRVMDVEQSLTTENGIQLQLSDENISIDNINIPDMREETNLIIEETNEETKGSLTLDITKGSNLAFSL
jgi:hypothetical protein